MESAVTHGLGGLRVVLLSRLNGADTGAAALDRNNDGWQLALRNVGDTFRLERNSAGGGGGHGTGTGGRGAHDHIDGGNLRLALYKNAADFRHPAGKILGNFILRCNGVPCEKAAPGPYGRFRNGLAPLHKGPVH
ncbi:hypothetical protein SDC9_139202 [bioreactor metagenome]|uniref:Uncharacterized protein n=1 Tax=bioreactor metagenome TaxID=1076179 RepID=A0A645DSG6_9ZZZZ